MIRKLIQIFTIKPKGVCFFCKKGKPMLMPEYGVKWSVQCDSCDAHTCSYFEYLGGKRESIKKWNQGIYFRKVYSREMACRCVEWKKHRKGGGSAGVAEDEA